MDEEIIIDPELWLSFLMMQMSDEKQKQEFIAGMSQRTGVAPDKVEECMHLLAEILIEDTRSN
jgi:hypothetical protein